MPSEITGIVGGTLASTSADLRRLAQATIDQSQDLDVVAYWFELAGSDEVGIQSILGPLTQTSLQRALELLGTSEDAEALSSLTAEDWLGLDLGEASVSEIAGAFEGMSRGQRMFLAESYPEAVGALDGAPLDVRFAANRKLVDRYLADLENEIEDLESRIAELRARLAEAYENISPGTRAAPGPFLELAALEAQLKEAKQKYADFAGPKRTFLLFDPTGDGRAIEVKGDLTKADHVAILVPGMNTELEDFGDLAEDAKRLLGVANRFGNGDVATIAWLGYDTPTARDVAFSGDAETGAALLDRFLDGLREHVDPPHVTAIGHSYGGVTTGTALRGGLDVDDAIFIGAPGTGWGVDDASELDTRAELWAGKNPLFDVEWKPIVGPIVVPEEFVPSLPAHGEDPTEEGFGTQRFRTNPPGESQIEGHGSYYDEGSESLYNMAAIVAGKDDVVSRY